MYLESLWEKSALLRKTCGPRSYVSVTWKGINREALSLIYTHLTLSSSHERERERERDKGEEVVSCWILLITGFVHIKT